MASLWHNTGSKTIWRDIQAKNKYFPHNCFKQTCHFEYVKYLKGKKICLYRRLCPNVSTTPITAMGCRQCLPLSVVQLKGKHCRKPHCRNGVVDTFGLWLHFGITSFAYATVSVLVCKGFRSQLYAHRTHFSTLAHVQVFKYTKFCTSALSHRHYRTPDRTKTSAPARVRTYNCAGTYSFVTTGCTSSAVLAIIVIIGRARDDPMKLSLNHKEIYYDRSQVKSFYELILIIVQSVKNL